MRFILLFTYLMVFIITLYLLFDLFVSGWGLMVWEGVVIQLLGWGFVSVVPLLLPANRVFALRCFVERFVGFGH